MAKLKRSLFIGLGGTGLKSILHTKKRFIDTYGEIPPMTAFLAFDTDGDSINVSLDSHLGDKKISLDSSEFVYIQVKSPQQVLKQQPELFDFVPQINRDLLVNLSDGAGQVRSNGRFATHFNYGEIENAIQRKLTSILNADSISNEKFKVNGNDVEINMMFSVAGGTGSGTFLDIAYIVKEVSKSINANVGVSTIAFAILPDVFNAMMNGPAMANVLPNGYGAFYDLDYLMHQNYDKKPLEIKYANKTIQVESPPFDLVFTINNSDKNANTYTKVNDLSELIGLAMFTGASELSGGMSSSYDNVKTVIAGGSMKVANKHSWACGLGLSELYYDGNKLGNIYAHKASVSIINNLIAAETDSFNLDDIFITDAKIRENNGNDDLIDSLLSPSPKIQYSFIQDEKSVENEIKAYLGNVSDSAKSEIEDNFNSKETEVNKKLNDFVIEHINKSYGVGNVERFLNALTKHVNLFLNEMKEERDEKHNNDELFRNQLNQTISELKELGFMQRKLGSTLKNTKSDVIEAVNLVAGNIHEHIRRQYAITFFNNFLLTIDKEYTKIKDIKHKLKKVAEDFESQFIGLQNQINEEPKKFVKELHRDFVNTVAVLDEDISVSDFIKSFSSHTTAKGIYNFSEVSEKLIKDSFWGFSKELPKALEFRNRKIDDVLSTYTPEKLNEIIRELITKSNPLWSYNYQGHVVSRQHHEAFIVGVPNSNNSVFVKDNLFLNLLEANQKADFNSTSMDDRIVIYRMEATVPIYAVSNMPLYGEKSKISNISHHIDANWLLRMQRENFDIYPAKREDHNLEYWVTGFIYDFIKFDGEKYMAYSEEQGDPIEDYWIELGHYRDEAFEDFKRRKLQEEFKRMIDSKINALGETENQKLIKEVTTGTNYNENFSKKNFDNNDLKDSKMIKVRELFSDEINFVKKVLAV